MIAPYYRKMIQGFSPAEIEIMLGLPSGRAEVALRIRNYARCKAKFKELVELLDPASVPTKSKTTFATWLK